MIKKYFKKLITIGRVDVGLRQVKNCFDCDHSEHTPETKSTFYFYYYFYCYYYYLFFVMLSHG